MDTGYFPSLPPRHNVSQAGCTLFFKRDGEMGEHIMVNVTLVCPCITNIFPSYSQQDATFLDLFISADVLHVSGGSSAHHQEHKNVHTASGIVNQYCC